MVTRLQRTAGSLTLAIAEIGALTILKIGTHQIEARIVLHFRRRNEAAQAIDWYGPEI